MKTQISTNFSLDCQTKAKKDWNLANNGFLQKRQIFCNFYIWTKFLDKLLMVQLVLSR